MPSNTATPGLLPPVPTAILSDSAYQQATSQIFWSVLAVLLLAGLVAMLLARMPLGKKPHAVMRNFSSRVRLWWWMAAILSLAFWLGKPGITVLFGFISFYCLREFISLQYTRRSDHWAIAAGFYLILPLQYALIWLEQYDLYTLLIPVYAFLFLPMLSALHADSTRFLERSSKVQWGLMVAIYGISHVPALLALQIADYEGRNLLLIAFLVLVVQSSDIAQYLVGKLTRGMPLIRRLVPEMTVKTIASGLTSATLMGLLLWWMTPFALWQAPLIALVIAVVGMFGNLLMAAIKRDRGIASWGDTIVGYGSMLDKLESVIFAAPIFFHIIHAGWV
jgi:phosphatidate cytidylyltransferase